MSRQEEVWSGGILDDARPDMRMMPALTEQCQGFRKRGFRCFASFRTRLDASQRQVNHLRFERLYPERFPVALGEEGGVEKCAQSRSRRIYHSSQAFKNL